MRKTRSGICNQCKLLFTSHSGGSASLLTHRVLQIQQHLLLTVQSQPPCVIKAFPSVVKSPNFSFKDQILIANELTREIWRLIRFYGCSRKQGDLKIKISEGFPSFLRLMFPFTKLLLLCTDFQGVIQTRTLFIGFVMCLSLCLS
jgi:hypothetical protein